MPFVWSDSQPTLSAVTNAGEDLRLRPWTTRDASAVFRACQDSEIQKWTTVPNPYSRAHAENFVSAKAWEERNRVPFAVTDAVSEAVLGSCGLVSVDHNHCTAEIGYWVAPWARKRGIATAATFTVADWALNVLRAQRLVLEAAAGNEGSLRVAASAGFTKEGIQRSKASRGGERLDMVLFSALPGEIRSRYPLDAMP